jgi:hypothetical protein
MPAGRVRLRNGKDDGHLVEEESKTSWETQEQKCMMITFQGVCPLLAHSWPAL